MEYHVLKDPMSILEVSMNNDEILRGDGGAFVFKKGDIDIKTQMRKGFFKNIKVALLGLRFGTGMRF